MSFRPASVVDVTEAGLALPVYTQVDVTYQATGATYVFTNHSTQVATVVLTYDGSPTGASTANLVKVLKTVP